MWVMLDTACYVFNNGYETWAVVCVARFAVHSAGISAVLVSTFLRHQTCAKAWRMAVVRAAKASSTHVLLTSYAADDVPCWLQGDSCAALDQALIVMSYGNSSCAEC
jgi:hypothetical protein